MSEELKEKEQEQKDPSLLDDLRVLIRSEIEKQGGSFERKPTFEEDAEDNGVAGSDVSRREKSVVVKSPSGLPRYESLSTDLEKWAKDIPAYIQSKNTKIGSALREGHDKRRGQLKAQSEATLAAGGALVPEEFENTVIEVVYDKSVVFSKTTQFTMSTNKLKIPKLKQTLDPNSTASYFGGVALVWTEEAAAKTETDAEFELVDLEPKKLAAYTLASDELLDDAAINIVNYLTRLMSGAIKFEYDNVVINGTGVGRPLGIVTDPNTISVARAGAVGIAELVGMDDRLNELFTGPDWIMRKATGNSLRTELTAGNVPLWTDPWISGIAASFKPPAINGYPVTYTGLCPASASAGGIILADLEWYYTGIRQGMTIAQSEHYRFINDQLTLRVVTRVDGHEAVPDAFIILAA